MIAPAPAFAVGTQMFATVVASTGEKPQSKLWYHDGSYWAILQGPDGLAFYEKVGTNWQRKTFADAILASSGNADVKWTGTNLFVLNYASTCRVFKYTYQASTRAWQIVSGFPVTVPNPSDSETMVLEVDSSGRVWTAARGGTSIFVYYSTSADQRTWSSTPVTLQTGVNADDICSIVAFGGDKVGVFWSDQNRDQFGFRVHQDTASPTTWGAIEVADSGSGHADDHLNLAYDSTGRVYAVTKDDLDQMRVHRRGATGGWTTKTNVLAGIGTRGVIMVAEATSQVYILYTRWGITPETIQYRVADIATLTFGGQQTFISGSNNMNNVTDMKQILPSGSLIAVAEDGANCWFNSFGAPPGPQLGPPTNVTANLLTGPMRVQLAWSAPTSGTPNGYNIYRQENGGSFAKINASLVTSLSYTDTSPPAAPLCYQIRAVASGGAEGTPSASACVDNSPLPPPQPPEALSVTLEEVPALIALAFDAGSGQVASDASGNGNNARLGSATGTDSADPIWVAGHAGTALQFDGSNDYIEVPDSPTLDVTSSFTAEAWVRRADGAGTGTVLNKGPSNSRTYRILLSSSGDVEFLWETSTGSDRLAVADAALTDSEWHHIACVYDQAAGQNRVYIDGALAVSANATGTPATNSQTLQIGARLSSSLTNFLEGAIDGLRIAPGALYTQNFTPAARIETMLAVGAGGGSPPRTAAQRARLAWQAPESGPQAASYNVYRSVDQGAWIKLNANAVTATTYNDANLVLGSLCYRVTAVNTQGLEGSPSQTDCVTVLPPLPGAPQALVATAEAQPAGNPPGIAAYEMDEGAGQTLADLTGHGHLGQLGSAAGYDQQDPVRAAGIFGNCLRFGGDDRVLVADAEPLRFTESFTLEAWIEPAGNGTRRCIVSKGGGTAIAYSLAIDTSNHLELRWHDALGALQQVVTANALTPETWVHVAGVYDQLAGEARLYVNGAVAGTATVAGPPVASPAAVYLGVQKGSTFADPYLGCLDLVRLSSGALYNGGFQAPHSLQPSEVSVDLAWQAPSGVVPAGYHVYRRVNGGAFTLVTSQLVTGLVYTDATPPLGALCYRVVGVDGLDREGEPSATACVPSGVTDAEPGPEVAGSTTLVLQASPNPTRDRAVLQLALPRADRVRLDVYNPRGERVARVCDTWMAAGRHRLDWDGRTSHGSRAAAGVYWLVLDAGDKRERLKLVLLR